MRTLNEAQGCCPHCGTQIKSTVALDDKINLTLLFKENKKYIKVSVNEIEIVEGMKDYLKIYVKDRIIITHMTMNKIEEILDKRLFWRVNRSFIVKKSFISSITYSEIEMANKMIIPIGINYREFIKSIVMAGYFE